MGFLDRLFGTKRSAQQPVSPLVSADRRAVERYRYLLRTAPPDAIEQAHAEAFRQLTPQQRAQVLRGLAEALPTERTPMAHADPHELARMATRAEMRQPGTLERVFGRQGGMGMGGMFAGTLLSTIAGTFIGTTIAHQFLGGYDAGANADEDSTLREPEDPSAPEYADADDEIGADFDGGDMDV